jgi:hypothetical protein
MKRYKRYTTEEYVARAQEVHGDTYDYSSVVYTHNQNKVIITCPKHGPFPQMARAHLKGQGCNECGYERVRGWKNVARLKAKERGDKFFDGKPCNKGHTTRYVCNNSCYLDHRPVRTRSCHGRDHCLPTGVCLPLMATTAHRPMGRAASTPILRHPALCLMPTSPKQRCWAGSGAALIRTRPRPTWPLRSTRRRTRPAKQGFRGRKT